MFTAFAALVSTLAVQQTYALPQVSAATSSNSSATACNNSPALCNRAYNNVTHLGAHDSPFVSNASNSYTAAGNQYVDSITQLSSGVRLLSAQVHNNNGTWSLCHTDCQLLDAGSLGDWLGGIKGWLDNNPNEVVTLLLVNSDNATPAELGGEFNAANLVGYAYTPSSSTSTTWPTLQSMISSGKRLVTFVASITTDSAYPYLLNEFDHVFENPYSYTSPTSFSCDAQRPSSDTQGLLTSHMPLQNHFLDQVVFGDIDEPDVSNLGLTNAPAGSVNGTQVGSLAQSTSNCTSYWKRAPTFVLVDYFNVGPAIDTVDALNGVTNPVGRASMSTASPPPQMSTSTADRTTPLTWYLVGGVTATLAWTIL